MALHFIFTKSYKALSGIIQYFKCAVSEMKDINENNVTTDLLLYSK